MSRVRSWSFYNEDQIFSRSMAENDRLKSHHCRRVAGSGQSNRCRRLSGVCVACGFRRHRLRLQGLRDGLQHPAQPGEGSGQRVGASERRQQRRHPAVDPREPGRNLFQRCGCKVLVLLKNYTTRESYRKFGTLFPLCANWQTLFEKKGWGSREDILIVRAFRARR